MPTESYFETHRTPRIRKRIRRRFVNENDPNRKGKARFQDDYGL